MCSVMPYPCIGPPARVFNTNNASVPCKTSLLALVKKSPIDIYRSDVSLPFSFPEKSKFPLRGLRPASCSGLRAAPGSTRVREAGRDSLPSSMGFLGGGAMILRMAGLRDSWLVAILILEAIVSIEFVPRAAAQEDSASTRRQERAIGPKTDYAGAAEALENELARAPESAQTWMKWADFDLERFRVFELELRSTQSGM